MSVLGQSLNLLSSILIILLICPNSNTLLCYSKSHRYLLQVASLASATPSVAPLASLAPVTGAWCHCVNVALLSRLLMCCVHGYSTWCKQLEYLVQI